MTLQDLTDTQLMRIYLRLHARLSRGMGYQPFGLDRPTMLIVNPSCMRALDAVCIEAKRRPEFPCLIRNGA